MPTSSATTRGVQVDVASEYVEERSDPSTQRYFFAYHIRISNHSDEAVKLISRHWIITNADGAREEVQGPGVVGEKPLLQPGEFFEYTSFCPLTTPVGVMYGTFQMITEDDQAFDATIAPFTLSKEEVVYH